jgi:hypothetical protein
MTIDIMNASTVAARQTGYLEALISEADRLKDYDTCIRHLKILISIYSSNEYNNACYTWLYQWKKDLEKYENLQTKRTAR